MSVTLIDLRRRGTAAPDRPDRPDGRILVLDEADTLLKHVDIYQDLAGRATVAGVLCVAVGAAGPEAFVDGVALAVPAPLLPDGEHRSAVLWVGDPRGLCWAPHTAPSYLPDEPALDGLIAALQAQDVFDAVLAAAADMPGAVASPAVRLGYAPARAREIGEAGAAAVRDLREPGDSASRSSASAVRRLDAEHDPTGPLLTPPIAARARDAQRTLDRTDALVRLLGTGWTLLGTDRPTSGAGVAMRAGAQAAAAYRAELGHLLNDMDGHIEEGRPPLADVVARGVAEPQPARGQEIAGGLRRLVAERLGQGVTLPDLAHELQAASAFSAPQGVTALHEKVRRLRVPGGELPPFPRRPLSLWTLPLIALTCLAPVLLAGPGLDGLVLGLLLAAVWTCGGWLLLARRPTPDGERGFGPSAPAAWATYGAAAAAGVAAGYALREGLADPPEMAYPMLLFGVLVVLALAVVVSSWRSAARRWCGALPLAELHTVVTTLDATAAEACVTEWQPMRRRRAIAAVAAAAAGGVDAVRRTLDEAGDDLLPGGGSPPDTAAVPELVAVVRGDLVELCRAALAPVWSAAEAPYGSTDADVVREFRRLLAGYREHVARNGLMSPFTEDADPAPRDALLMRAWTGSSLSRDVLLTRPGDAMTQLCDDSQLGFLSTAAEPALIRFAPWRLVHVLRRDPTDQRIADDPRILWTRGGELVGAVRLTPLRPESIRPGWDGGEL